MPQGLKELLLHVPQGLYIRRKPVTHRIAKNLQRSGLAGLPAFPIAGRTSRPGWTLPVRRLIRSGVHGRRGIPCSPFTQAGRRTNPSCQIFAERQGDCFSRSTSRFDMTGLLAADDDDSSITQAHTVCKMA
jgi:hypothetical protein